MAHDIITASLHVTSSVYKMIATSSSSVVVTIFGHLEQLRNAQSIKMAKVILINAR